MVSTKYGNAYAGSRGGGGGGANGSGYVGKGGNGLMKINIFY